MIKTIDKKICPLVNAPSPDCYCFNLTSSKIEEAIYYCSGHFEECGIFRNNFGKAVIPQI